ncbi:restriction endonuclease subunit S [Cognaticolwellia aestuarii]|uniref:restriction endonuclease subunit S n=1 Tax=Cognaticolwellia aestuarii TaxID=329993 RepID=UPI0009877538|nr:restriction endonuclease subunit S [Cognaticolwellia aestuarii]
MKLNSYDNLITSEIINGLDLPAHWRKIRFRHLFSFDRGLGITKANLKDEGIPCVNYGEIHSKFGFEVIPERDTLKCVDEDYLETGKKSLLQNGDFVFADTSEDLEGSGNFTYLNSDETTFAGYHTVVARLQSDDNPRYIAYLFDSGRFRTQVRKSVTGVKVFSITQAILKSTYVWLPTIDEQSKIVELLDFRLSKIDDLINKKKLTNKKLSLKRLSLINSAVTLGIKEDNELEESNIAWLGKIPKTWKIRRLKFIFNFSRGLGITRADLKDSGIPCINYGEIHSKYGFEVDPERDLLKCVDETYYDTGKNALLDFGDFVFADTSEDLDGSGSFTYLNSKKPTFAGYHTVVARLRTQDLPRYFAYLLDSEMFKWQIRKSVSGVKVFSITQGILKSCYAWYPSLEEQLEIVSYLDKKTDYIKNALDKNNQAIEKLMELRKSLIDDAVTGKIDLRDIETPEEG